LDPPSGDIAESISGEIGMNTRPRSRIVLALAGKGSTDMPGLVRLLLASTLVAYASAGLAQSVDAQSVTAMRRASSDLTASYLQAWSTPRAASPDYVTRVYAPRIRFYGRVLDRNGLVGEKRRFVRRWPVRQYAVRPGTVQVACDQRSRLCRVSSVLDWRAESPARRAVARGSSSFEQRFDFSTDRPAVVHEGGRVLPSREASRVGRG
jgi:hypothetical protein